MCGTVCLGLLLRAERKPQRQTAASLRERSPLAECLGPQRAEKGATWLELAPSNWRRRPLLAEGRQLELADACHQRARPEVGRAKVQKTIIYAKKVVAGCWCSLREHQQPNEKDRRRPGGCGCGFGFEFGSGTLSFFFPPFCAPFSFREEGAKWAQRASMALLWECGRPLSLSKSCPFEAARQLDKSCGKLHQPARL